ncbi:MAG: hypothetical protein ABH952_02120 [Candidatus Omnitrophota bacterium]
MDGSKVIINNKKTKTQPSKKGGIVMCNKIFHKTIAVVSVYAFLITTSIVPVYGYSFTDVSDLTLNPYSFFSPSTLSNSILTEKISPDATELGDLSIAPPPVVITTSSGDIYLYQSGQMRAKMTIDQKGTDSTTFYANGAPVYIKDEFGKITFYNYSDYGQNVTLTNSIGAVVGTEAYRDGFRLFSDGETGKVTYIYDEDNQLIGATDPFGNTTNYENARPINITDSSGEIIGTYLYNGNLLSTYTDQFGNTTHFGEDGIRPIYTKNAQGTITQVYQYNGLGNLEVIVNKLTGETTSVLEGYSTSVVSEEGALVMSYSYADSGYLSSTTKYSTDGIIGGWTIYDDYGRPAAVYNAEGSLVQTYEYNDSGFIQATVSYGKIDPLTDKPMITGRTTFDEFGRPSDVYNAAGFLVQTYQYDARGMLDITKSYGDVDQVTGQQALTGWTIYDDVGRALEAYNFQGDLVQKYYYNTEGFLDYTVSLGLDGAITGKTIYNQLSRPSEVYNETGNLDTLMGLSQVYLYGADGFLSETVSYGQDNTITGYTKYDAYSRPTDVYNVFSDTVVQQYVYNERGFLDQTNSFGYLMSGVDAVVTEDMKNLLHQLEALGTYNFGDFSSATLVSAAWNALAAGNLDEVIAYTIKCIELYRDEALTEQAALSELPASGSPEAFAQWALNDVGTAYYILGEALRQNGQDDLAKISYGVVSAELKYSQCWDPTGGLHWQVATGSLVQLNAMGAVNPVLTGYTKYDSNGRPNEAYQVSATGVAILSQKFDYKLYDEKGNVVLDGTGKAVDAGFLQRTWSYGAVDPDSGEQVVTGFTTYNEYGKQGKSYNDFGEMVQTYVYSDQGFLSRIYSYGQDMTYSGLTIFDNYGRQKESYNYTGDLTSTDGLTQRYVYTNAESIDTGFLQKTISYGENNTETGYTLYNAFGRPDAAYNAWGYKIQEYDYVNGAGINDGFMHRTITLAQDGTQIGATYYNAFGRPDYAVQASKDVSIDSAPVVQRFIYKKGFLTQTESLDRDGNRTNVTFYDKRGMQDETFNVKDDDSIGVRIQEYRYSQNGFIKETISYNRDGQLSGRTTFNDYGQQEKSFNQSYLNEDSNKGLVQTYTYLDGFLVMTESWGEAEVTNNYDAAGKLIDTIYTPTNTGKTIYDIYQRPKEAYNAFDELVQSYDYMNDAGIDDGFLTRTYSYGATGLQTGYTVYNGAGRPTESWSMSKDSDSSAELNKVQAFTYKDGFLDYTTTFGKGEVETGKTYYDGFGRQEYSVNEDGNKVQVYKYSNQGFLQFTTSMGNNGVVTGTTAFDKYGRQSASYNDRGNVKTGAGLVQTYDYTKSDTTESGFLQQATSYGTNKTVTGTTRYDEYNRPDAAFNAEGVQVQDYVYEGGFLSETQSLNKDSGVENRTFYNDFGRPFEVTNFAGNVVQTFNYEGGFLKETLSYGAGGLENITGKTVYDNYGRQIGSYNANGGISQTYQYNKEGFLSRTNNYSKEGTFSGFTMYDDLGRPDGVYNYNGNITTQRGLIQEYQYDDQGFVWRTVSYGDNNTITGETYFDIHGRPDKVYNAEGVLTMQYIYDGDNTFILPSNWANFCTATPNISGGYTGNVSATWEFKVLQGGTVGEGTVTIGVFDKNTGNAVTDIYGNDITIDLGSEYNAGSSINVGYGVKLSMEAGDLVAGNSFDVDVAAGITESKIGTPTSWTLMQAADPKLTGTYLGPNGVTWSFRINMDGVIGVTAGLKITVTRASGGLPRSYDIGAGYDGSAIDLGSGMQISFSNGAVVAGAYFTASFDKTGQITQSNWDKTPIVTPTFTGKFTGTADEVWTFKTNMAGTIGQTAGLMITAERRDTLGNLIGTINLDVGAGYVAGSDMVIAEGVSIAFSSGDVLVNDSFTADLDYKQSTTVSAAGTWQQNSTAIPQISGRYLGDVSLQYEITVNTDNVAAADLNNLVIGATNGLRLKVKNLTDSSEQYINIGAGYIAGDNVTIYKGTGENEEVAISLNRGTLHAADKVTVDLKDFQSSKTMASNWSGASTTAIAVSGTYSGSDNDVWTCRVIAMDGMAKLRVTDSVDNVIGYFALEDYTDGTALNIADGVSVSFSGGTLELGDCFMITLERRDSVKSVVWTDNSTAEFSLSQITSGYTGTGDDVLTFNVISAGTVGLGDVRVEVRDHAGNLLDTLQVGNGYNSGTKLNIGNTGLQIAFTAGDLKAGHSFDAAIAVNTQGAGITNTSWQNAVLSKITLGGEYSGADNDMWSFVVNQDGQVGVTAGLTLTVYDSSGAVVAANINIGAGYTAGSIIDIADGVQVALDSGMVEQNSQFKAQLTYDMNMTVSPLNKTPMASSPKLTGTYTGPDDVTWTFKVSAGGTVGSDNIVIEVYKQDGSLVTTVSLNSGYVPGTNLTVADGIEVMFNDGKVLTGDEFSVNINVSAKNEIVTKEFLWNNNTTSLVNVIGLYTGPAGEEWTFTIIGSGEVGAGNITLRVTDKSGALIKDIDIGSGLTTAYLQESKLINVADGIQISFSSGLVRDGDSFTVDFGNNAKIDDGFLDCTLTYGDFDPDYFNSDAPSQQRITSYTLYNAKGQATETYSVMQNPDWTSWYSKTLTQMNVYTVDGYLDKTLSFGKDAAYMGMTEYDNLSRQTASYNEYGQTTQKYQYNSSGFMYRAESFGVDGTKTGYTLYNDLGRPEGAYNSKGITVQKFEYSGNGFLSATYSLQGQMEVDGIGMVDIVTSKTVYDASGRQKETYQVYQYKDVEVNETLKTTVFSPVVGQIILSAQPVQTYLYDGNGFLNKTISWVAEVEKDAADFPKQNDDGTFNIIGWKATSATVYNEWGRPDQVLKTDDDGNILLVDGKEVVLQNYFYTNGFMYASVSSYYKNNSGEWTQTAPSITYYDAYGRGLISFDNSTAYAVPPVDYKDNTNRITSRFKYDNNTGFLSTQQNFGDNNKLQSTVYYDRAGHQVGVDNQTGMNSVSIYDQFGFMRLSREVDQAVLDLFLNNIWIR